jgi:hypothetical protein
MKDVPHVMDRPRDVADRLVTALVNEGLVTPDSETPRPDSTLHLP